jgi:hypothetical protein
MSGTLFRQSAGQPEIHERPQDGAVSSQAVGEQTSVPDRHSLEESDEKPDDARQSRRERLTAEARCILGP